MFQSFTSGYLCPNRHFFPSLSLFENSDSESEIDHFHASSSSDSDYASSDIEPEENKIYMASNGDEESSSDENQLCGDVEETEVEQQDVPIVLEKCAKDKKEQAENMWFINDRSFISRFRLQEIVILLEI